MNKTTEQKASLQSVRNALLSARSDLYDLLQNNPQWSHGRKHVTVVATKQISQAIANLE